MPPAVREAQERRSRASGGDDGDAGSVDQRRGLRPRFSLGWFGPFSAGIFIMAVLGTEDPTTIGQILFVVGVAGTGYGLARLTVRWLAARRER